MGGGRGTAISRGIVGAGGGTGVVGGRIGGVGRIRGRDGGIEVGE